MNRRELLRSVADECVALVEKRLGRPSLKLSALGSLSDDELGSLIPMVLDSVDIEEEAGMVFASMPKRPDRIPLFPAQDTLWSILDHMDGLMTLSENAHTVESESGRPYPEIFAEARRLFLQLVHMGLCLPANLPGSR